MSLWEKPVLDILESAHVWLSRVDIAERSGVAYINISRAIDKLYASGRIAGQHHPLDPTADVFAKLTEQTKRFTENTQ